MCVCGKECHLTFRIATIGAVCVGFDELPDSEAIRGLIRENGDVLAHELVSLLDSFRRGRIGDSSTNRYYETNGFVYMVRNRCLSN